MSLSKKQENIPVLPEIMLLHSYQSSFVDSMPPGTDNDSIERMTVLGARVTNPYTITITKQAYANLGITNVPVTVTNLYIRFKPTIDQVSFLDSVMDGQGLELFDAPFDYQN